MARSPMDSYYTRAIPDPAPKIHEQWSWDEFLGGLAQGAVSGLGAGINLKELGEKEQTRRLAQMDLDPEPYEQEYQRRFGRGALEGPQLDSSLIPGRDFGKLDIPDLGSAGIPERTTVDQMGGGIDLMRAKEARDRETAKRRLVFSDEVKKELEGVSDSDLKIFQRRQDRKERETEAGDIKTLGNEYVKHVATMNTLLAQRKEAEAKLETADKTGNVDLVEKAENQLEKINDDINKIRLAGTAAEAQLIEAGASAEEMKGLRDRNTRSATLRAMLMRLKGSSRTRSVGSK